MAADSRRKAAWRLPWLFLLLLCARLPAQPLPRKLAFAISDYPPFEYAENGVPKGMSVEITRMVFRKMGCDISITLYPWKRALHMVSTGEVDGVFSASRTREREAYGVFPKESLVDGGTYFFTLRDGAITYDGDLAKLAGYTIGTDRGSSYGDRFDEAVHNRTIHIIESDVTDVSFRALLVKRVDLYLVDGYVGAYLARKAHATERIRKLEPAFAPTMPGYLLFSRKQELKGIIAEFDATLAALKKDGSVGRILRKYLE